MTAIDEAQVAPSGSLTRRQLRRAWRVPFRGPVIESGPWTRRVTWVLLALAFTYLAFQLVVSVFQALDQATSFSGYALDGAFQLYNPLRRMAAGEIPGRDFPFFHGVGVPWLHYPAFVLFGGNIFASELTRWLLSPLLFGASGFLFLRALLGNGQRALIALSVFVAVAIPRVQNLVDPGNSLIGIRSMTPLLVAAAMLWTVKRHRLAFGFVQTNTPLIVAYALLGVAVALGTEQGLAAIGAFLLIRFVQNIRRLRIGLKLVIQTLVDVAATVASVFLWLTVLTAGNAIPALQYALRDVPQDQGWVFGSIPNQVVTSGSLLWSLQGGPTLNLAGVVPGFIMAFLFGVLLVVVARAMRLIGFREFTVFGFLWIYGLAVLVGLLGYINLDDQLAPFGRVSSAIAAGLGVTIVLTLVARAEQRVRNARARGGMTGRDRATVGMRLVGAVALLGLGAAIVISSIGIRADILKAIPKRTVIAEALQGPGSSDYEVAGAGYKAALDSFRPYIPEGADVWATYTSLYSSDLGVFTPAPGGEDYMIHALGRDRREAYQQAFIDTAPEVVITTMPYYTAYEEWLWARYPVFFEQLITHYTLTAYNGSHILWLRNDAGGATAGPAMPAPVSEGGAITLPGNDTDRVMYYALTVQYEASGGPIPVLNRLPRFYLRADGAALGLYAQILPNDETEWTLVIPVFAGQGDVTLSPFIDGIAPQATLDIDGAEYRVLDVPEANDDLILWNYCSWKGETDDRCAS